jgi:hypothetical protein
VNVGFDVNCGTSGIIVVIVAVAIVDVGVDKFGIFDVVGELVLVHPVISTIKKRIPKITEYLVFLPACLFHDIIVSMDYPEQKYIQ